jgi:hypothetical protein
MPDTAIDPIPEQGILTGVPLLGAGSPRRLLSESQGSGQHLRRNNAPNHKLAKCAQKRSQPQILTNAFTLTQLSEPERMGEASLTLEQQQTVKNC